ncbi:Ribosome biogenesis GTPase A [Thalassocella blandensis]|nr:Ribosome biogenesis GTPase A [Thalassocella blandensis]
MAIQWYPGHMHKAQKEIRQTLPKVDLIIEILDARIPFSSENPLIASIRGDKPCVKVLSKSDLADEEKTRSWQEYLEQERHVKTLATTMHDPSKIKQIPELCNKLVPERAQSVKKVRAMIVGIPNVGKSTLINILAGRTIAKTGNEPAVTKTQQQVHVGEDLLLFDTPGILWPKQEFEKSSYRLAATGAIKDTALEYDDVAFVAAEYLLAAYPDLLKTRYELDELPSTELDFFETIGRKRGCLGGGGLVDLKKISQLFINDYRAGILGNITLETPEMVEAEKREQRTKDEEKQRKKQERLSSFKKKRRK